MQASQTPVIWTVIIVGLILVALGAYGFYSINKNIPETPVINVPTAQEIADAVVVPVPVVDVDLKQQTEIWEKVYRHQIRQFKEDAIEACQEEFKWSDIEDLFDKYADVEFVEEFEDDRDFIVVNLGLDDEDDREMIIDGIMKVRIDDDYSDLVYGHCVVTSDDGDLEAELSFNL